MEQAHVGDDLLADACVVALKMDTHIESLDLCIFDRRSIRGFYILPFASLFTIYLVIFKF